MSSAAAHADHNHSHGADPAVALRAENITLPAGAGKGMGLGLIGVGLLFAVGCLVIGATHSMGATFKQALAAYHLTTMAVLAMSLGALFFVLVFHLTNAGWSATIRRQFENIASFVPFAFLLVVPTLVIEIFVPNHGDRGYLFAWLSKDAASTHLLQAKWGYFFTPGTHHDQMHAGAFPTFFVLRALIYGVVWTGLSLKLRSLSLEQDTTGDRALSARARFISSWGMILFALSTAFAAFDWLMSIDYGFFSTMWGVYYFAGAAYSSVAVAAIVLAVLRLRGKLEHAVTSEHFHDLGKLMFTFTVFWAYIGFSQYFLIWYSNIPEETAFYEFRNTADWRWLNRLLILGHFVIPFLILLFRPIKRSPKALIFMGLWAVTLELADLFWIVRPAAAVNADGEAVTSSFLVDALGILGVMALFAGYLIQKVPQHPLVALKDPRMPEALGHKNYV